MLRFTPTGHKWPHLKIFGLWENHTSSGKQQTTVWTNLWPFSRGAPVKDWNGPVFGVTGLDLRSVPCFSEPAVRFAVCYSRLHTGAVQGALTWLAESLMLCSHRTWLKQINQLMRCTTITKKRKVTYKWLSVTFSFNKVQLFVKSLCWKWSRN